MGWLVPNFGKGGSIGDSDFWFWSVFGTKSVHLFLPFEADTPARNFRIWQKYWAGPPPSLGSEYGDCPQDMEATTKIIAIPSMGNGSPPTVG